MPSRAFDLAAPTVSSRHHPLVATCRALARGEDRTRVLLDGPHLVAAALAAGVRVDTVAFSDAAWSDPGGELAQLRARATDAGATVVRVSGSVMDALSPVRTPSGVVAVAARPEHRLAPPAHGAPLLLIAVDVQDPGNVGAIVRAAEGAGATAVLVAGASADPFSWKALRGSMGSTLRLPVSIVPSVEAAVGQARALGCAVLAMMPHGGRPYTEVPLTGPVAILLGGEGPGLSADALGLADAAIAIPMAPPVESLNVAVAAALVVFEARRQRAQESSASSRSPAD